MNKHKYEYTMVYFLYLQGRVQDFGKGGAQRICSFQVTLYCERSEPKL